MLRNLDKIELAEGFKLKTMVSVEELASYDMIYIYHHVKSGANVQLKYEEKTLLNDMRYGVYFKGFKLGVIKISGVMKTLYEGIQELEACISSISKQKYLPFTGLDITIQAQRLKMVS